MNHRLGALTEGGCDEVGWGNFVWFDAFSPITPASLPPSQLYSLPPPLLSNGRHVPLHLLPLKLGAWAGWLA